MMSLIPSVYGGSESCRISAKTSSFVLRRWTKRHTGLERHEGECLMTSLNFYVNCPFKCLQSIGVYFFWSDASLTSVSLIRYDPRFNTWIHLANMIQKRTHFSLNTFNGLLFAVGGRNSDGCQASVECYVPSSNQWQMKAAMEVPRCCHASTVIDGKILVSGGYINNAYSRSVCSYNPSTDSWQDKNSLSTPRGWHSSVGVGDRAYVLGGSQLGGRGERVDVLPVECYNPHSGQWCYVTPLLTGVSTAGAATLNNKIFLLGGWNEIEKKYKKCIQVYNPDLNEWTEDDELPEATVGISCCVVTIPTRKTRESRASSVSSAPVSI